MATHQFIPGHMPMPLEATSIRAVSELINGRMFAELVKEPDCEMLAEMLDVDPWAARQWAHQVLGR